MAKRPEAKWIALLLLVAVGGLALWNARAIAQANQAAKDKTSSQTSASKDKLKSKAEQKGSVLKAKVNPKALQIEIQGCQTGDYDKVHAPKKSDGGLVVFTGDSDYTVYFQFKDFWQGSIDSVAIKKDVGAALYTNSDGGTYTHFCMTGTGCNDSCPPTAWPPLKKKEKGKLGGSDPNDIVVP